MFRNIAGAANTAVGDLAMENNDSSGSGEANFNCAFGAQALESNVNGDSNNAVGAAALSEQPQRSVQPGHGRFRLSRVIPLALQTSPLVTRHSRTTQSASFTVIGDLAGSRRRTVATISYRCDRRATLLDRVAARKRDDSHTAIPIHQCLLRRRHHRRISRTATRLW